VAQANACDRCTGGPKERSVSGRRREEEALWLPSPGIPCCLSMTVFMPCRQHPHLTRSSLHRCLQRPGISRLLQLEESKTQSKFKQYPIDYFQSILPKCGRRQAVSLCCHRWLTVKIFGSGQLRLSEQNDKSKPASRPTDLTIFAVLSSCGGSHLRTGKRFRILDALLGNRKPAND